MTITGDPDGFLENRVRADERSDAWSPLLARESVDDLPLLPRSHARQTVEFAQIDVMPATGERAPRRVRQSGTRGSRSNCRTNASSSSPMSERRSPRPG